MDITRDLTLHFQNEIHRPSFPYKFKIKCSGCPNDCAAASARSDLAIIGLWRDQPGNRPAGRSRVRPRRLEPFRPGDPPLSDLVLEWDAAGEELQTQPAGLRPLHALHQSNAEGARTSAGSGGAALLIGGKVPVVKGAMIGWVLVPFMEMKPPYHELKELIVKITDYWAENAKNRERVAELIDRVGFSTFLAAIGLKPAPQMVNAPRANPYLFWRLEEVVKHG